MDKTTLKQLKPGTLFRLKDSESSPVRDHYDRSFLKLMLAINTKTTIMKLSSKEPKQYSLILHIRILDIMNIKKLFNRFRKREPELSYSLNLIYLEDTKVVFNQNIQCAKDLENYLSAYMRLFGMYSDKPYVLIYQEYKNRYWVYDKEPYLLYYKVPPIVNLSRKLSGKSDMVITKEEYQAAKDLVPAHEVSDRFKIPEYITGVFTDIWYKCQGYMDTDHDSLEEILELMQHNWLKEFEWLVFKRNYDTDMLFLNHSLTLILDQTEEEGRRICIQNIIERNINQENQQENQDENETV
jgi:hypothetical protein